MLRDIVHGRADDPVPLPDPELIHSLRTRGARRRRRRSAAIATAAIAIATATAVLLLPAGPADQHKHDDQHPVNLAEEIERQAQLDFAAASNDQHLANLAEEIERAESRGVVYDDYRVNRGLF
jgi:threonine aldolase